MKRGLLQLVLLVVGALLLGGYVVDHYRTRQLRRELAEANNRLVAAEETAQVAEHTWQRGMFVVSGALRMEHLDKLGALEELERARLEARGLYNVAIAYRAQLTGTSQATVGADTTDTVIPIDVADGHARAKGEVVLHDHRVPAEVSIDVLLEIALAQLRLALAIGEDPDTGSLVAQATTDDPHVEAIEIEAITDLRSTGIGGADEGPSRLKWGGIGVVVGAAACLLWCQTP